jgi:hypothetical protein
MKIIKEGQHPSTFRYRGQCTTCKSVVEFEANEVRSNHDQRDGDWHSAPCPVCKRHGEDVVISLNQIDAERRVIP